MAQAQSWRSAHDERDYEFAKTFGIDILPVIAVATLQQKPIQGWTAYQF